MEWMAAAICGILGTVLTLRTLGWIQYAGYRIQLNKKFRAHLLLLVCLSAAFLLLTAACYAITVFYGAEYVKWILLGLFSLLSALFILCTWKKSPTLLKFTPRAVRLLCALTVVHFLISRLLIFLGGLIQVSGTGLDFSLLFILPVLVLPAAAVALISVKPVESAVARHFISKAKKKLDERQGLIRIGITGSYGKTSVKNMIATLLGERAYATPASYNTPMGVCKAISDMPEGVKYFICEMGAGRRGDIARLCSIVRPQIGVLTGIAPQHLKTFKSLENIIATKGELVDSLPCKGIAVFNGYDDFCADMFKKCVLRRKFITGKRGVSFSDVELDEEGSRFVLKVGGEERRCFLRLVGRHNIENFCLAMQTCLALGEDVNDLCERASEIAPVPHRLEVLKTRGGITILDDGYNSNVRGAKAALDALSLFKGRKVVAAQGFAEAGKADEKLNTALGEQIACVADIVVLIGVKAEFLRRGLEKHAFPPERIYIESSLERAQRLFARILREGDVLLIENDMPENLRGRGHLQDDLPAHHELTGRNVRPRWAVCIRLPPLHLQILQPHVVIALYQGRPFAWGEHQPLFPRTDRSRIRLGARLYHPAKRKPQTHRRTGGIRLAVAAAKNGA